MKKFRKIVILIFTVSLLFILFGMDMPIACHARGRVIERDDWRLWQFTYGSRNTTLLGLNDRSLIVDGVMTLPIRVGRRNIDGIGSALGGAFNPGPGVDKIVIPVGLRVGSGLWSMSHSNRPRYIELLCDTFDNIFLDGGGGRFFIIILPDGSTQNFYNRIRRFNRDPSAYTFIEKSQFGGIN